MLEVSERFLQEEQANSGTRFDPVDRARFHRMVRLCAENWIRHPQASLRLSRGKAGLSLLFEGPMTGRLFPLFTMRVDYKNGEYRFIGPNPDRRRMALDEVTLEALERLRDLYEASLAESQSDSVVVTAELRGKPFPDLVPLVEESRRVLDGGFDGAQPSSATPRRKAAEKSREPDSGEGGNGTPGAAENIPGPGVRENPMEMKAQVPSKELTFGDAPLLQLVLNCPDPKESAAFYRRIFGVKSDGRTAPGVHAIYRLGSVELVLKDDLTTEERRLLGVGNVQKNRGWGAVFVIQIPEFQGCLRRIKRVPDALVRADAEERRVVIRDPAGYLLELVDVS